MYSLVSVRPSSDDNYEGYCFVSNDSKSDFVNVKADQQKIEPRCEKTGFLHMRKQSRRSAAAQLISAFVFAIRIVQSLYFVDPKFQASSHLL